MTTIEIADALACIAYNKSGKKIELIDVIGEDMYAHLFRHGYIIEMPDFDDYVKERTIFVKEWVCTEKYKDYISENKIVPIRIVRINKELELPQTIEIDKAETENSWIITFFVVLFVILFEFFFETR